MATWPPFLLALLAINLAAFVGFGIDKGRARTGGWRISEATLLLLAVVGGTIGAYLGRWHFRHKTRKTAFSLALHLIAVAQFALLIIFAP
ncbi:DUF1294 domain-containing protein [Sphingobium nicotianae]|uniref:DUF1294 domain-containing protein n=1 Tax=Sphingobium nicotianae TaxID=2782607 RepID=A0A9X1AJL5_9SPHN|nr:DUF1294 domain-containing protein [Sphingobium nicotianae]MBT2185694.1 DUF1294 domain-containing protein [Sphingobium nicotianae]